MRPPRESGEHERQQPDERNLVELRRMAWDAVAVVDGPGERSRKPMRMIIEAGEETTDAADTDSHRDRYREQVARRSGEAEPPLDKLDGEETAGKRAHDTLTTEENERVLPMLQDEPRIGSPVEELVSDRGAHSSRGDDRPTVVRRNGVAGSRLEPDVEAGTQEVG